MAKKIFIGMLAVFIAIAVAAAGYGFGRYLARAETAGAAPSAQAGAPSNHPG